MNLVTYSHVEARLFLLAAPSAMFEDIVDYYIYPSPLTQLFSMHVSLFYLNCKTTFTYETAPKQKDFIQRPCLRIGHSDSALHRALHGHPFSQLTIYILMYNYWFIPPTQWRRSCVHVLVKVLLKGRSADRHDRVWEHFVVQFFAFAGEMPSTWYLAPIVFIISWKPSLSATL